MPIYPPTHSSQIEEHVRRHAGILNNARAVMLVTVPEARPVTRLLEAHVPGMRRVVCAVDLLRARLTARTATAHDPSDADLAVLEHQIATAEPVLDEEELRVLPLDGRRALDAAAAAAVSHTLFGARRRRSDHVTAQMAV